MSSEERVKAAFNEQARICERLGSPFTAHLLHTLARWLHRATPVGSAILDWGGDPGILRDNLPLRVAGALHALARARGREPGLAALYPPAPLPAEEPLYRAVEHAFRRHGPEILLFLRRAPQANEPGRSSLLLAGLLALSARLQPRAIALLEPGASAGLNLVPDRYRHQFGRAAWGPAGAALQLVPEWHGPAPPVDARLAIASRRACDLEPLDLREAADRARLAAYVWADQPLRLQRLEQALTAAAAGEPPQVECADAQRWLEVRLLEPPAPGTLRVIWHSLFWSYLDVRARARIEQVVAAAAAHATAAEPLAWLRYELEPRAAARAAGVGIEAVGDAEAVLRLDLWPKGGSVVLARGHPHGERIDWRGFG